LDRRRLDLRSHDVAHWLDPVGHGGPPFPVPLLNHCDTVRLVILAGHFQGTHHSFEAELVELSFGEIEILEPPAHLILGWWLLPKLPDRSTDSFRVEHAGDDRAVVEYLAHSRSVIGEAAFPPVIHELEDILMHFEICPSGMKGHRLVTF